MNQRLINWQRGLDSTAIEEYNSLRRSLQRNRGFGLFFVQCSPAVGTNIVGEISKDIKQQKIATLKFDRPIDSLYNEIEKIPNIDNIDILFISGLEHSLLAYEEYTFDNGAAHVDNSERYFRSKRGIPRFLGYLNLQRDRFKRDFPLSLVFLVPIFGIQYLIERTPDFFDWRSGFFRFIPEKDLTININIKHFLQDSNQSRLELLDIHIWAKKLKLNFKERLKILSKEFFLLLKCQRYKKATVILYSIIKLNLNEIIATVVNYFSNDLLRIGRYKKAIAFYDKCLVINPDRDSAWFNRGYALGQLEKYQEEIDSYDKCLAINPNEDIAWFNRGYALGQLERYEEAIASYDKCLAINPDQDSAWFNRANDLGRLERCEEAIASYDKCLAINPDQDSAWFNRANDLSQLERYEEAIASFDKCLAINPNYDGAWFNRANDLGRLKRYEEAIDSYNKCLAINPDQDSAWFYRGNDLGRLKRYEEAIASFDKCLAINPNEDTAWFYRACCLALLNQTELAIESLTKAIAINPKWMERAKTDSDFDRIRQNKRFQSLVNSSLELSQ